MKTPFTELIQIGFPIMQAPVGGSAGPELASAVSNAGALGSLTIWNSKPEQAIMLIDATRKLTKRPFSVNIRADLNQVAHIEAALQREVPLIHLFWGDPSPYASAIHRAGGKLICTVASADEARQAIDAGADILIAQGWEAGGHVRGTVTTLALIPTVVDLAGNIPVLAAGGIADGRGVAAGLMLGAAGVVMGSRFVASHESRAHVDYKNAIVQAGQADTVYVENLFEVGWPDAPHRVLRNSTVRLWEAAGFPPPGFRPDPIATVATRADGTPILRYSSTHPMAGMIGDTEALALYAGQGIELIRELLPAAAIVELTMRQARETLAAASRLCQSAVKPIN